MASQLLIDLYQCNPDIIDNAEQIKSIAHRVIREIDSDIVEECFHKFEPIGITYVAVITKSHFSIHTWPEYGYAAVDIFSCDEQLPDILSSKLQKAFGAGVHKVRSFERDIEGRGINGV